MEPPPLIDESKVTNYIVKHVKKNHYLHFDEEQDTFVAGEGLIDSCVFDEDDIEIVMEELSDKWRKIVVTPEMEVALRLEEAQPYFVRV